MAAKQVPKVRAWSNTVRKHLFHPADVDLFVLRDHQPVLLALGRQRVDEGEAVRAAETPGQRTLRQLACVAPVFTLVLLGGSAPQNRAVDVDTAEAGWAVPVLLVLWSLAAAGPVLVLRRWWHTDRRRDGLELAWFVVVIVLGAAVLRALATSWDAGAASAVAAVPVGFTTLAAAGGLLVTGLASRGRRTQGDLAYRRVGEPDPTRARQLLEALPARVREQLHDMRARAVENLRGRGLVDDDEAARILSTPLGEGPLSRR